MLNLHNKWIKDGGKSDQPIHHITHRSGFGGNVEPTKGRRESVRGQPEKPGATRENGRPFFHAKLDAGQERSGRKDPFRKQGALLSIGTRRAGSLCFGPARTATRGGLGHMQHVDKPQSDLNTVQRAS